MPADARRGENDPYETAPSHSGASRDAGAERRVRNLAELMGMPLFRSTVADFDHMPLLTAPQ
eukprot:8325179-Pyramimonas_sp.AAC.1